MKNHLLYQVPAILLLNTKPCNKTFFFMYNNRSLRRIKSEFNPTVPKANTPNYTQRKGRTIQTSPLFLRPAPTEIMTRKKLEKMYKTLLLYKFKFPGSTPSNVPFQPFMIYESKYAYQLFPESEGIRNYHFGKNELGNLAFNHILSNYPEIANLYRWHFQLLMIQFINGQDTNIDANLQYFINWNTNLIAGTHQYQIFIKSVNAAITTNFKPVPIEARPNGYSQAGDVIIRAERISIGANGNALLSSNNLQSSDFVITDNAQYPYIDTRAEPSDLTYGELEFAISTGMSEGSVSQNLVLRLFILCIPNN